MRVAVRNHALCRVGFVVPKHGRSSVQRNQLKRRLRELTRINILSAKCAEQARSGVDIVMRALPNAYRASFDELGADVEALQARLLRVIESSSDRPTSGSAEPIGG